MKTKRHPFKGRYAVIPMISLAMLSSTALAGAQSTEIVTISANAKPIQAEEATPSILENAKFSKEQAIEKVRSLFPMLKDAQVQHVELGDSHMYPPPANQMVWNIQWNYQKGNSGYGFSSMVTP